MFVLFLFFYPQANILGGKTGAAAVEATFLEMEDAINDRLFLYETPLMEWMPSTVYRFDAFFDGLKIMHAEGVVGMKVYLGGDCVHCHMYGLVNVAAFLAQAMKETIRYDACDENSWDRVGAKLMYPISVSSARLVLFDVLESAFIAFAKPCHERNKNRHPFQSCS